MENIQWPPPGSMGPIFGEYLYIRFFKRNNTHEADMLFWDNAKMDELLMQIRYKVVPDREIVTDGKYTSSSILSILF